MHDGAPRDFERTDVDAASTVGKPRRARRESNATREAVGAGRPCRRASLSADPISAIGWRTGGASLSTLHAAARARVCRKNSRRLPTIGPRDIRDIKL